MKDILGFAAGPVAAAVISLVTVPATAWVFSPEDVGRLNIYKIILSFGLLLTVLGLDQAYVREYHETQDKARLFLSCFAPGFLLLVMISASACFFAGDVAQSVYADDSPQLFFMTLLGVVLTYITGFLSLILRMQEKGWAYSAGQAFPKILQLILIGFCVFLPFHKKFVHLLIIALSSLATVALVLAWNTRAEWCSALQKSIKWNELKRLFGFGVPLIFSGLAYWGLVATSTFALRAWSTLDDLAVYSVANSFAGAAMILQSIFSVVWAPTVYKWKSQGADMRIVDQVALQMLAVICAFVALCGAFSWICDLLLPVHYANVRYLLLCMMMQPLLYTLSEVTCVGIAIQRRTIYTVWIALAAMTMNVLSCMLLARRYGATGAAVANALAFTVFFMARTEVSARIWRQFPRRQLYCYVIGFMGLAVAMAFWAVDAPILVHVLWGALFLAVLYLFKAQWYSLLRNVQGKLSE